MARRWRKRTGGVGACSDALAALARRRETVASASEEVWEEKRNEWKGSKTVLRRDRRRRGRSGEEAKAKPDAKCRGRS
eukprot:2298110-Rhodomonas_salina.1